MRKNHPAPTLNLPLFQPSKFFLVEFLSEKFDIVWYWRYLALQGSIAPSIKHCIHLTAQGILLELQGCDWVIHWCFISIFRGFFNWETLVAHIKKEKIHTLNFLLKIPKSILVLKCYLDRNLSAVITEYLLGYEVFRNFIYEQGIFSICKLVSILCTGYVIMSQEHSRFPSRENVTCTGRKMVLKCTEILKYPWRMKKWWLPTQFVLSQFDFLR